ncbi:MAG: class I SAM-dependent methyltransferase [Bradyrhizobium sp.]|uniref:class I SAM-dependent methyltransferase n=1 Tax=Bradyrhizobium sp. TaxID=376 RepID=UPI001A26DB49|nr:class I SAM-dependent methyltransferase [Bradyrhizobium sp.]MBJ7401774.1 class I SAM-dependent methyltransferase [Bradyrhizobium sp.]
MLAQGLRKTRVSIGGLAQDPNVGYLSHFNPLGDAMDFPPILQEMLSENQTIGRSGKIFRDLPSNSTVNNLKFIQQTMRERRPLRTLEIGLAFGASTLVFCTENKKLGHAGEKQHTAIDPYQPYSPYDEAGVYAVERAKLADYLDYRPEFSEFVLPRLLESHQRYDFIYIDGSHLFENVFIDTFYCARLLNDGGWMALDDSSDPHVAKVIEFMRANLAGAVKEISLGAKSALAGFVGRRQLTVFERLPYDGPHGPRKWDTPLRVWDSKFGKF